MSYNYCSTPKYYSQQSCSLPCPSPCPPAPCPSPCPPSPYCPVIYQGPPGPVGPAGPRGPRYTPTILFAPTPTAIATIVTTSGTQAASPVTVPVFTSAQWIVFDNYAQLTFSLTFTTPASATASYTIALPQLATTLFTAVTDVSGYLVGFTTAGAVAVNGVATAVIGAGLANNVLFNIGNPGGAALAATASARITIRLY